MAANKGKQASAHNTDDLYAELGVKQDATPKQLRSAYLQLLVSAHPDKGGSTEQFAAIQRAYAALSDPGERAAYDERLSKLPGARPSSKSAAETSSQDAARVQVYATATAFVHGQIRTPPASRTRSEVAGQGVAVEEDDIAELSQQIQRLKQRGSRSADPTSTRQAAEVYIERGQAHAASGRLHHALFDAREALELCPDCEPAITFMAEMEKVQAEGAGKWATGK